jgi:indolepyruvate ferredoxin oxidoreductase alpha subunit
LDLPQHQHELSLLSGDEAVTMAAFDAWVKLGIGSPGTPATEILETFETLGGKTQWASNEKVALDVCIGVCFPGERTESRCKMTSGNEAGWLKCASA